MGIKYCWLCLLRSPERVQKVALCHPARNKPVKTRPMTRPLGSKRNLGLTGMCLFVFCPSNKHRGRWQAVVVVQLVKRIT